MISVETYNHIGPTKRRINGMHLRYFQKTLKKIFKDDVIFERHSKIDISKIDIFWCPDIAGAYGCYHDPNVIYLINYSGKIPHIIPTLVHELTHHIQCGQNDRDIQRMEFEAYFYSAYTRTKMNNLGLLK